VRSCLRHGGQSAVSNFHDRRIVSSTIIQYFGCKFLHISETITLHHIDSLGKVTEPVWKTKGHEGLIENQLFANLVLGRQLEENV
jgi:hypothetical protein